MSVEWEQKRDEWLAKFKADPYDFYNPVGRSGWRLLSEYENLACVVCVHFFRVLNIENNEIKLADEGTLTIGCDHEVSGGYKKVSIIPDPKLPSGGLVSTNSERSCSLGLIPREGDN